MKALLIDDHAIFRAALAQLLAARREAVFLNAGNAAEALEILAAHPDTDVVLLDLGLPDMDGLDLLDTIRSRHDAIPVVILSANEDPAVVVDAINRGAMAYVSKASNDVELNRALERVLDGNTYVPPAVATQLANANAAPTSQVNGRLARAADFGITGRQADVLFLLLQGLPNKSIARRLDITEATVKAHSSAIFRALQVANRTQAVLAASRLNIGFD